MDTDVDSYTHNEIITLLKLDTVPNYTIEDVKGKVKRIIERIQQSDMNDKEKICQLFRDFFTRVCVVRGFPITVEIRDELGLPPLPALQDDEINLNNRRDDLIVERKAYEGSLRPQVPYDLTTPVHQNNYVQGLVNPVYRETITTIFVINSKFRDSYIQSGATSQSDRIREKTLCTKSVPMYNILTKTKECETSSEPTDTVLPGCYTVHSTDKKGETTDFTTTLSEPITNVVSMRLSGLELMNQYYPISEYLGTNVFTVYAFTYDPSLSNPVATNVTQHQIILSDGAYNVTNLQTYINTIFSGINMPPAIQNTTLQYNILTGKFRFEVALATATNTLNIYPLQYGIDIDFRYPNEPDRKLFYNLGWMMGFRETYYSYFEKNKTVFTTTYGRGINAEAAVNLSGTNYFLVEVDDFNNNHPAVVNYNCDTKYSYNIKNILGKIPNIAATNELLFEDSSDRIFKTRKYFGPVRIQKLRIRLLDENGRQLNLGENDFTINLEIESLNTPYKSL
jgi:hypothetical protein